MGAILLEGAINGTDVSIVGWVRSGKDRGTIDILWSCCVTIFLCVWVSTYPNVPSRDDKWYHRFVDKVNLALIGLLGPDFLFGLAIGQLANARRSVRKFRDVLPHLGTGAEWTMVHAFYADMGGFLLCSPDYPNGFPINAEQLLYLVVHGHIDFPNMTKADIKEKNMADRLSKTITVLQVIWFTVMELQRVIDGYPLTTLELTALTFAFVMVATSASWHYKPAINRANFIFTRNGRTVESIRAAARSTTHPGLPHVYYRTPLDFLSRHTGFHIEKHWRYYSELTYIVHLPLFNRRMETTPWTRFPSDLWLPAEGWIIPFGLLVQIPFSLSFLLAWFFHYPTMTEQMAWRACSIYHAVFSLVGTIYYMFGSMKGTTSRVVNVTRQESPTREQPSRAPQPNPSHPHPNTSQEAISDEASEIGLPPVLRRENTIILPKSMARLEKRLDSWRNISPDQDPEMEIALRRVIPILVASFIYIFCRLFFYVEDFIGLRTQPAGVYQTVNRFLPFL